MLTKYRLKHRKTKTGINKTYSILYKLLSNSISRAQVKLLLYFAVKHRYSRISIKIHILLKNIVKNIFTQFLTAR